MNSFGESFKIEIFGESHGESVGVVINGCPPGLSLSEKDFLSDISRRKSGKKGTTPRIEADKPIIESGVFEGKTTGAPLAIIFENQNTKSKDYDFVRDIPRPGHADFVANVKYKGNNDHRGGGHFSGRLTLPLVAAGVVAKKITKSIEYKADLVSVHGSNDIAKEVDKAIEKGDSVGGVIQCKVKNVPIGFGDPFFSSLESLISHAVFSIPAVKGIEFGAGFKCTEMYGSENNDLYISKDGKTATNNTGGISGGISNGNDIDFKVAIKPTSSISKPQKTFNMKEGKEVELKIEGRHDACIALRVSVVVEAVTAIVLADFISQKR